MNWSKSANLIIASLLILNLALGFMISADSRKYILEDAQKEAVIRLLSENNIEVKEIPRKFPPLRAINMAAYAYDYETLKETFLGAGSDIRRTFEFSKTKYTKGDETLVISSNVIEYINESGGEAINLTVESARRIAEDYYKSFLSNQLADFAFDSAYETDGGVIVDFRGLFRSDIIYSNYIRFYVSERGIVSISCEYRKPEGHYGEKKQICSPDEALVTFMYEQQGKVSGRIVIDKMDIVYYPVEITAQRNEGIRTAPFYRIYVAGTYEPFLINAYTNSALY